MYRVLIISTGIQNNFFLHVYCFPASLNSLREISIGHFSRGCNPRLAITFWHGHIKIHRPGKVGGKKIIAILIIPKIRGMNVKSMPEVFFINFPITIQNFAIEPKCWCK